MLHGKLGDVEEASQVGGDQGVEVVGSEVGEGLAAKDSGVVDEDVDGSEALNRGVGDFGGDFGLAEIAVDENQAGGCN